MIARFIDRGAPFSFFGVNFSDWPLLIVKSLVFPGFLGVNESSAYS
jgi:hypothetical protein